MSTKQPIFTPPIAKCAICGAAADVMDWNFDMNYQVMCKNNHTSTKPCGTIHRAIMKWNNKQKAIELNPVDFFAV